MNIKKASLADLEQIFLLQREVYVSEAKLYDDFSIPPLVETAEEMRDAFSRQVFLKLERQGEIFGSVRGFNNEGVCTIGRLIVKENHQNQGHGAKLLQAIESFFPMVDRYELFTGAKSLKNLHLYQKCGYRKVRQQEVSETLTLVYLQKTPADDCRD